MTKSTHTHPNPQLDRFTQYGAVALVALMVLSVPFQLLFIALGAPGGIFVLTAIATLALASPVLMLTASTPALTLEGEGFWIEPVIWKRRFVHWEEVHTVQEYPLLPSANSESQRRLLVGRKNYRAAEGFMLIVPTLPTQYRIAGFFAGAGGRPIIAITNRTHVEYEHLKKRIVHYLGDIQPYD